VFQVKGKILGSDTGLLFVRLICPCNVAGKIAQSAASVLEAVTGQPPRTPKILSQHRRIQHFTVNLASNFTEVEPTPGN
jgi:hypothetical protein